MSIWESPEERRERLRQERRDANLSLALSIFSLICSISYLVLSILYS